MSKNENERETLAYVRCVYEYQNKSDENYTWNGYFYLSDAPLKNGFEGITTDKSDSIVNNRINERYLLGKKEGVRLNFVVYPGNIAPLDYQLIKDPETGFYLGYWNYVDFYKRNIRFGGAAKLEFTELEDFEKQKELLGKIEKWNDSKRAEDYAIMICEQYSENKATLRETFLKQSVSDAKRLVLKQ